MKARSAILLATMAVLLAGSFWVLRQAQQMPPGASSADPAPPQVQGHVKLLLVGDPFAYQIEEHASVIAARLERPVRVSIRRYARTLEEILQNHKDSRSAFHLVSFDILWLPKLVREGVLEPISWDELAEYRLEPDDFHASTLQVNTLNGRLYGLPIQPHMELLWYRKDLLAELGLAPPRTLDELLRQARVLHRPEDNFYGICWNALRGQALGQTVAHLYAAFGGPIIDDEGRVAVDTPAGVAVLDFLQQLLEVSPPDIFTMAWDQRIDRFAHGKAAFTYGWTARAAMVEKDPLSRVQGKVGYLAPPVAGIHDVAVPFGQWSLGVPANLTAAERQAALRTLAIILSPEIYALMAADGNLAFQRKEQIGEEFLESVKAVAGLMDTAAVSLAARPGIEQWPELAEIVGTHFHDVLLGRLAAADALQLAQEQAEALLVESASGTEN